MRQIVYNSRAKPDLGQDDVFQIVQTSARNNGDTGLSGFLVYLNGAFFQVLEGPEDQLQVTLSRIQEDDRHTDLTIILDRRIEEPQFSRWRMRRVSVRSASDIPSVVGELNHELHDSDIAAELTRFARDNQEGRAI